MSAPAPPPEPDAAWLRRRARECLEDNETYTRDVGRGWGGRRRDLSRERLEQALAEHARIAREGGAGLIKRGRRSVVTRGGGVVIKERRPPGPVHALRDAILPRRHAAGYRHAHLLQALGVGTARPLAHVQRGRRTWTLYEDLGALERLDERALATYARATRPAQVRLREASARWLGDLHRRGIYHGDLKASNLLVEEGPSAPGFRLIDTDHCRFSTCPVDRRRRAKNLAQLSASIPLLVSRSERLRWFRRYEQVLGAADDVRALAREVGGLVAQRVQSVDTLQD